MLEDDSSSRRPKAFRNARQMRSRARAFPLYPLARRFFSTFNQPLSGNAMPRAGNTAETSGTFMRLPSTPLENMAELDVCVVGIPIDIGTSLRPGTRFGPRQVRQESAMLRPYNMATKAMPFDSLNVGDVGDVPINTFDLKKSVDIITNFSGKTFSLPFADHTLDHRR